MNLWLSPDTPSKIPVFSTHSIGAGGLVISECGSKFIAIKENMDGFREVWKLPGGLVDSGETVEDAVVREVKEETGIDAGFIGIIGHREILNFRFGQGDIYYACLM
jgi:ADP-ribose pyrophosphatase YjhB (NUDIX family)